MSPENQIPVRKAPLKYIAGITPGIIFILLTWAIIFYKERMLYIDAPHILFRIINDGHFWIEEHRYGSFISQVLPLIGAKIHLPLKWLLILYSAGFYLFYMVVSLLLVYRYRNYGLAVLLGLYFTLFVSETFFWSNNEVHQGIAWLFMAFAISYSIAEKNKKLIITTVVFAASFSLAIWTHPLIMLVAIYLWFFHMADKATWPFTKIQTIVFTVILLLLSFAKFYQGMHHGYDSSKIETLTQFQYKKIATVLSSPQFHFFLKNCVTEYWLFSLLFLTGLIGLMKEKKYLLIAWILMFVSGYLLLTSITFWNVTSRCYMESEYSPLGIICCAPFVYYVLPKVGIKPILVLFILIYLLRLSGIYTAAPMFTYRVALMEKITREMKEQRLTKVIIPEPVPGIDSALITNWAAPVESIYISKLAGETPQRTFIFLSPGDIHARDTVMKDTLLGSFELRSATHINAYYFQMDTTTVYKVMPYTSLMK